MSDTVYTYSLTLNLHDRDGALDRYYVRLLELPFPVVPGMEWPAYRLEPHRLVVERVFLEANDDDSYDVELAPLELTFEEMQAVDDWLTGPGGWRRVD